MGLGYTWRLNTVSHFKLVLKDHVVKGGSKRVGGWGGGGGGQISMWCPGLSEVRLAMACYFVALTWFFVWQSSLEG